MHQLQEAPHKNNSESDYYLDYDNLVLLGTGITTSDHEV